MGSSLREYAMTVAAAAIVVVAIATGLGSAVHQAIAMAAKVLGQ